MFVRTFAYLVCIPTFISMDGHVYEFCDRTIGGDVLHLALLAYLLHHPPPLLVQELAVFHPLTESGEILLRKHITIIFFSSICIILNHFILQFTYLSSIKHKTKKRDVIRNKITLQRYILDV